MKLVFATNNIHKLNEIRLALSNRLEIAGLGEAGIFEDIPENAETIEGNAIEKARFIYNKYKINCFADDTGLEVDALNGRPGVYSARYAGENCTFDENVNKLLEEMNGINNRKAKFRTVIALIKNGDMKTFEGCINGLISLEISGNKGFGYDSVFIPEGFSISFAEMSMSEKNKISHRARALQKLTDYLYLAK